MELFNIFYSLCFFLKEKRNNQKPKRVLLECFHFIIVDEAELEDLKLSKNESD